MVLVFWKVALFMQVNFNAIPKPGARGHCDHGDLLEESKNSVPD